MQSKSGPHPHVPPPLPNTEGSLLAEQGRQGSGGFCAHTCDPAVGQLGFSLWARRSFSERLWGSGLCGDGGDLADNRTEPGRRLGWGTRWVGDPGA